VKSGLRLRRERDQQRHRERRRSPEGALDEATLLHNEEAQAARRGRQPGSGRREAPSVPEHGPVAEQKSAAERK